MPSGPTTRPSTFAGPGWPEFAFDLTAVALGIAGLIGAGYVAFMGFGVTLSLIGAR